MVGDRPFLYQWKAKGSKNPGSGFRLERATYQKGALAVPPVPETLSYAEMDNNVIVVSERGSGFKVFFNWLKEQANKQKTKETWNQFNLRQRIQGSPEVWNHMVVGKKGNYLLDRTFYGKSPEMFVEDNEKLAEIGGIIEQDSWIEKENRFFCVSYNMKSLHQDLLFSVMLDKAHVYHLPQFTAEELVDWVEALRKKRKLKLTIKEKNALAKQVKNAVGGQPKLTHSLFRLVDDQIAKDKQNKKKTNLEEAFSASNKVIKRYPSNVVERWKYDIAEFIKNSPPLKRLFSAYAEGNLKPPGKDFTHDDVLLYLGGWVGTNADGDWGIRSECHRYWAVQVLRGL